MSKSSKTILVISVIIALVSCSKSVIDSIGFDNKTDNNVGTCGITYVDNIDNIVSINDIQKVIKKSSPHSKSMEPSSYDVHPYFGKRSDTLLYIVNDTVHGGWRIYSSDKRTPAILAEGEKGCFSLEEGNPAVSAWIECIAKDIERIRHSRDDELSFSDMDIRLHRAFWTGEQPRFNPDTIIADTLLPGFLHGHWEEIVYSQTIIHESIDHMVAKWAQDAPYNEFCPYYVSLPSTRADAGCVAIAGSQLLLYLHNKIGVPEYMVNTGSCVGDTDSFIRSFSGESNTIWGLMNADYQENSSTPLPEALMIGHVGDIVGMHYCDNNLGRYSWALPSNLKNNLFDYYGIECSRGPYNESIVKTSLLNKMPVIVSATNYLIPSDFYIHCFVIDGYLMTRTKYTHYHYFVLDETPSGPVQMPQEYNTYTYSSPQLTSIKINWGWASQWRETNPVNDGWYALTGGWFVQDGNEYYDYNYNRYMTYGFTAAE